MYLSQHPILEFKTHFGEVGLNGKLGFGLMGEDITTYNQDIYPYSVAAHAPSTLTYNLNQEYTYFNTYVGINDSGRDKYKGSCDFYIYANNMLVGCAPRVTAQEKIRKIECSLNNCDKLELVIDTKDTTHGHSVWFNPQIYYNPPHTLLDCYNTYTYQNKQIISDNKICIVSILTKEYIEYFLTLYDTILKFSKLNNFEYIVYTFDLNEEDINRICHLPIHIVPVNTVQPDTLLSKKFLFLETYKIIDANYYIYLDTDILIVDELADLVQSLHYYVSDAVLICRQTNISPYMTLKDALLSNSNNSYKDYDLTIENLNLYSNEIYSTNVLNSGFYIATREALCKVNNIIQTFMPMAKKWEMEKLQECWWREEAILTLCLSRLNNVQILNDSYNVQIQNIDVEYKDNAFYYNNNKCKIIHAVGNSKKDKYFECMEKIYDQ